MTTLRTIAIVVFCLWLVLDSIVMARNAALKNENRDRFSLMAIYLCNTAACTAGMWLSFVPFGSIASIPVQIAGLVAMCGAIVLRSTAIAQLGRFHSPNVSLRENHYLIESGLYRAVRHPSYSGALIAFAGLGFALGNWLSVIALLFITPWAYLYRMHEEETVLLNAFGEEYKTYCQRTKRLIPGVY